MCVSCALSDFDPKLVWGHMYLVESLKFCQPKSPSVLVKIYTDDLSLMVKNLNFGVIEFIIWDFTYIQYFCYL